MHGGNGRRRAAGATLAVWAENLTNQTYAFNFGNPFSGTHFGAPRRVGLTVRVQVGKH
jgi:outer membrane receptor protein involved in Fe transport